MPSNIKALVRAASEIADHREQRIQAALEQIGTALNEGNTEAALQGVKALRKATEKGMGEHEKKPSGSQTSD